MDSSHSVTSSLGHSVTPSLCHFVTLSLLLLLSACATPEYDDPVAAMMDRRKQPEWRLGAAKQAEAKAADDPKRLAAMDRLVWDEGHPDELRIYAIDQLIARDEKDFLDKLDRRIVLIPYGTPMDHIFALGKERRWPHLSAMLVKRWAVPIRGVNDDNRKERKWIGELNSDREVEQIVFETFTSPDEHITAPQRVGAWALLNRISTQDQLMTALAEAPATTALVVDLKAAAADLRALPRHREGIKWLYFLRDPARADAWQQAKANVAKLSPDQRVGLAMRHLAILPLLDENTLAMNRTALLAAMHATLREEEIHTTSGRGGGLISDYPQRLSDRQDKLSWADLATMRVLLRLVHDADVKRSLFEQADRDLANNTTEFGGVLDIVTGKPIAKEYPPMLRVSHNRQYAPTEEMIQHCYTGLAHYHFHAQAHNNSAHAGPGLGDIETAERLDFNFLVFTFIDKDRLNVDYHQPGGAVIDLGTLRR
ncbi:MAG: hypothetical protein WD768_23475 [Phycisphaeraceae bacterium]